jgi:hypothetical protein
MSVDAVSTDNIDAEPGTPWHMRTVEDSFERLKSTPSGLTNSEAARRLA